LTTKKHVLRVFFGLKVRKYVTKDSIVKAKGCDKFLQRWVCEYFSMMVVVCALQFHWMRLVFGFSFTLRAHTARGPRNGWIWKTPTNMMTTTVGFP